MATENKSHPDMSVMLENKAIRIGCAKQTEDQTFAE
jgi:hypothetical protein